MHLRVLPPLLASLLLAGCFQIPSLKKPETVAPDSRLTRYATDAFNTDYNAYKSSIAGNNIPQATLQRDTLVHRIRVDIDAWYSQLEEDITQQRAGFNTWSDVGELLLSGAATISNGERGKTVLAAILTASKGARQSYDKNRFREKTSEVLMTAMRAERAKVMTAIIGKLAGTARQYPFEEAWADLIAYFQAGTMEGALLALSIQTGGQAADAQQKVVAQNAARAQSLQNAPETNIALREWITTHLAKLDQAGARAVLTDLNIAIPTPAPADLREVIRTYQVGIAADNEAALKQLVAAIKKYEVSP